MKTIKIYIHSLVTFSQIVFLRTSTHFPLSNAPFFFRILRNILLEYAKSVWKVQGVLCTETDTGNTLEMLVDDEKQVVSELERTSTSQNRYYIVDSDGKEQRVMQTDDVLTVAVLKMRISSKDLFLKKYKAL